jgi:hypothetical protein
MNRVLACNYRIGVKACSAGSLAYVTNTNPGWGAERIEILARSRSGRWILKWESLYRLYNFRFKTMPDENPKSQKEKFAAAIALGNERFELYGEEDAQGFNLNADNRRRQRAEKKAAEATRQ